MSEVGLYQKLLNVMDQVERIPKNGWNAFHQYHYVQEADLAEAMRRLLTKQGVLVLPTVEEATKAGDFAQVRMRFRFVDTETGQILESVFVGEGQDKTDKAFYKAYTGALKYVLMKTFLIPTGDDPELDTDARREDTKDPRQSAERRVAEPRPAQAPQPAEESTRDKPAVKNPNARPSEAQLHLLQTLQQRHKFSDDQWRALWRAKFGEPYTESRATRGKVSEFIGLVSRAKTEDLLAKIGDGGELAF